MSDRIRRPRYPPILPGEHVGILGGIGAVDWSGRVVRVVDASRVVVEVAGQSDRVYLRRRLRREGVHER